MKIEINGWRNGFLNLVLVKSLVEHTDMGLKEAMDRCNEMLNFGTSFTVEIDDSIVEIFIKNLKSNHTLYKIISGK